MHVSFSAATDVGLQRSHNEDSHLLDRELRLCVVADGMGGHAAGEVASRIAVDEIAVVVASHRELLTRYRDGIVAALDNAAATTKDDDFAMRSSVDSDVNSIEILRMLERAILSASSKVYVRAQSESEKRGMGTTATVLLLAGPLERMHAFIAHVGDSRVYRIRGGECTQLTEDHSLANELIKRGKITREQADEPAYRAYQNAVTRAVGVDSSVEVDTYSVDVRVGDSFIVCSDGLSAYLDEDKVPAMFATGDLDVVTAGLIKLAKKGGGHDNITAVVAAIHGEPAKASVVKPRAAPTRKTARDLTRSAVTSVAKRSSRRR